MDVLPSIAAQRVTSDVILRLVQFEARQGVSPSA
jgi:hypothetical protein